MKIALAATIFAVASFPLLGQQVPPTNPTDQQTNPATQTNPADAPGQQPNTPATTPQTSASPTTPSNSDSQAATADTQSAAAQTPAADMRPVDGKLVNKLDSSTAKTGDDVVLQTESAVKTSDGTEIPKGSKLVGHVLAVHPSAGENSQVVLRFDRAELKDGKSLTIQSEIESVAPAAGEASASAAGAIPSRDSGPVGNAAGNTASAGGAAGTSSPAYAQPGGTAAPDPVASSGTPAAGTIVSRNGNIAIRTTSIPGILLANNAPGEQDPRMAQASGFLLGARKDVQLNDGTKMTLKVATASSGTH